MHGTLAELVDSLLLTFRICSPQDAQVWVKRPLVQGACHHSLEINFHCALHCAISVQAPGRTGGQNLSKLVKKVRNTAADSTHLVNSPNAYSPNSEVFPFHCIRRNAGARTASSSIKPMACQCHGMRWLVNQLTTDNHYFWGFIDHESEGINQN
jgi:hypothetical protein